MMAADTPMPGEDPGTLPDEQREGERDPASAVDVEENPQLESDSSLPPIEDDPEVKDTERHPA